MGDELKDCAWCGMPMEVVQQFLQRVPGFASLDGTTPPTEVPVVKARCLAGHWYYGPPETIVA